jgi:hypothetical protein
MEGGKGRKETREGRRGKTKVPLGSLILVVAFSSAFFGVEGVR